MIRKWRSSRREIIFLVCKSWGKTFVGHTSLLFWIVKCFPFILFGGRTGGYKIVFLLPMFYFVLNFFFQREIDKPEFFFHRSHLSSQKFPEMKLSSKNPVNVFVRHEDSFFQRRKAWRCSEDVQCRWTWPSFVVRCRISFLTIEQEIIPAKVF